MDTMKMQMIFQAVETAFEKRNGSMYTFFSVNVGNDNFKCISKAINLWDDLLKTEGIVLQKNHIELVFKHLIPTLFHSDKDIQRTAQNSLKKTLPLLLQSNYREHPQYIEWVGKICTIYAPQLKENISVLPEWQSIWCNLLTIIQKDVARSVQINPFLSIVEAGFRDNVPSTQTKSFICWRHLIEIFAKENQLTQMKRVKLIVMPLVATPSRTNELASIKFKCWWYLINHINENMCEEPSLCLEQFLSFCFGPLGEIPLLSYSKDIVAVSPGKLYLEMNLSVIVALVALLGKLSANSMKWQKSTIVEMFERKMDMVKVYSSFKQKLIHCCGEATVLTANLCNPIVELESKCDLISNLWSNLIDLSVNEGTLETFNYIMETISVLIQLSQRRHNLKPLIGQICKILTTNQIYPFRIKGEGVLVMQTAASRLLEVLQMSDNAMLTVKDLENILETLVLTNFKNIILHQNRITFLSTICANYSQMDCEWTPNSFEIWKYIWTNMVMELDWTTVDFQMDFLKCGLRHHYEGMLLGHEKWVVNSKLPRNACINKIAEAFAEIFQEKLATPDAIDVMSTFFKNIDITIEANESASPTEVWKLFVALFKRFQGKDMLKLIDKCNEKLSRMTSAQFNLIKSHLAEVSGLLETTHNQSLNSKSVITFKERMKRFGLNVLSAEAISSNANISIDKNHNQADHTKSKSTKVNDACSNDEFVPISRDWTFDPKQLTNHQTERLKQRRDDIPAMYNDNSQSQDSKSLQAWSVKTANDRKKRELDRLKIDIIDGNSFGRFSDGPTQTRNTNKNKERTETRKSVGGMKNDTNVSAPEPANDNGRVNSAKTNNDKTAKKKKQSENKAKGVGNETESSKGDSDDSLNRSTKVRSSQIVHEKPIKKRRNSVSLIHLNGKSYEIIPMLSTKNSEPIIKKEAIQQESNDTPVHMVTIPGIEVNNMATATKAGPTKTPAERTSPRKKTLNNDTSAKKMNSVKRDLLTEELTRKQINPVVNKNNDVSMAPPHGLKKGAPSITKKTPQGDSNSPKEISAAVDETNKISPVTAAQTTVATADTILTETAPFEPLSIAMETQSVTKDSDGDNIKMAALALEVTGNSTNISMVGQRSILSSPEMDNSNVRETTLLNDTMNISPILKEKVTSGPDTGKSNKETPIKHPVSIAVQVTTATTANTNENHQPEVLTTPKRNNEMVTKDSPSTAISTTPHPTFLSRLNGRGAQMLSLNHLQVTKQFHESTPKEKDSDEPANSSDSVQKMLTRTVSTAKASPSTSILRRKRLEESLDDTMDYPLAKKKKVSFSDPPVSATKEYQRDSQQNRPMVSFKSKLDRILPRKSKTVSATEIRALDMDGNSVADETSDTDSDVELGEEPVIDAEPRTTHAPLAGSDDSHLIRYLQKKYAPNAEACDYEEEAGSSAVTSKLSVSQCQSLFDVLLKAMANSDAIKEVLFQRLLLEFPKDTLKWTIRENSTSSIIDLIPTSSHNSYIINKLKSDSEYEKQLCRDLHRRMDPEQKIRLFVKAFSEEEQQ